MKKILMILTATLSVFTVVLTSQTFKASNPDAILKIGTVTNTIDSFDVIEYEIKGNEVEIKVDGVLHKITDKGEFIFNVVNEVKVIEVGSSTVIVEETNESGNLTFTKSGSNFQLGGSYGNSLPPEMGYKIVFTNVDRLTTTVSTTADNGNVILFKLINNLTLKKNGAQLTLVSGLNKVNYNTTGTIIFNGKVNVKVFTVVGNEKIDDQVYTNIRFDISKEGPTYYLKNASSGNYEIGNDLYIQIENIQSEPVEDHRPAISGQENFVMNVNENRTVEYFISFLKAIDEIDGDISDQIKVSKDNFTQNKKVLGKHSVTVYVVDSSDNRSELEFFVNIVDITVPIINGNGNVVEIGYKETFDIENFRKTLTASDNYDTLTNADIKLATDNYTANKAKLGNWDISFEVSDKSGNTSSFNKRINVIDNIKPSFAGTEEISKSYKKTMTLSEILSGITANDEIDGNLTERIKVEEDTFSGNGNKVGKYTIKISVTDNAGNIAHRTITVNVIDDQGADWFIVNGVTINLTKDATLTRTQIVELLAKTGQVVANKNAIVTYSADTYTENIGMPGVYTLAFTVANPNGIENSYTYGVNVLDDNNSDSDDLDIKGSFFDENKEVIVIGGILVLTVGLVIVAAVRSKSKNRKKKR